MGPEHMDDETVWVMPLNGGKPIKMVFEKYCKEAYMFDTTDFASIIRGWNAWSTPANQDPIYQHYLDDLHSRRYKVQTDEQIRQAMRDYAKSRSDFDRFVDFRNVFGVEHVEDESLYDKIDLSEVL